MVILPVAITSMPSSTLMPRRGQRGLPAHRVEHGVRVLQPEIAVARAREARLADLAAHPHARECAFELALERKGKLGDGEFRDVAGSRAGRDRGIEVIHCSRQPSGLCHLGKLWSKPRHANPGGGRRRPRTCAVLGDFGLSPVHKAVLCPRQCRHRRGRRMPRCRRRGHSGPGGAGAEAQDRLRGDRARRAAGRRHGRRLHGRGLQGVRPVEEGRPARRLQELHQGAVQAPQHPDRRPTSASPTSPRPRPTSRRRARRSSSRPTGSPPARA